jgi:hypothetical protein
MAKRITLSSKLQKNLRFRKSLRNKRSLKPNKRSLKPKKRKSRRSLRKRTIKKKYNNYYYSGGLQRPESEKQTISDDHDRDEEPLPPVPYVPIMRKAFEGEPPDSGRSCGRGPRASPTTADKSIISKIKYSNEEYYGMSPYILFPKLLKHTRTEDRTGRLRLTKDELMNAFTFDGDGDKWKDVVWDMVENVDDRPYDPEGCMVESSDFIDLLSKLNGHGGLQRPESEQQTISDDHDRDEEPLPPAPNVRMMRRMNSF